MSLKDLMTREIIVIDPGPALQAAADRMAALGIEPFPGSQADWLVGVLVDHDTALFGLTRAGDTGMASLKQGARWLVVLDARLRLVGVVPTSELAEALDEALPTSEQSASPVELAEASG